MTRPLVDDDLARTRSIGAMFGRIAGRYDLMNRVMTGGLDRRWRRLAVREVLAADPADVLDIGTGTGELALAIARAPGVRRVAGFDLSPAMLHRATTKPGAATVSFGLADAIRLPFADGSFDAVTTAFMLRNVPDVAGVLSEARRVLRPSGRFVCLEITRQRRGPFSQLTEQYFRRVVPWIGRQISGDPEAYSYLPRSVGHFLDARQLQAAVRIAGFRAARYRYVGPAGVALHVAEAPGRNA